VLNFIWSPIFNSEQILGAGIDILLLWFAIIATIRAFWALRPFAATLLFPYFWWVSFASALNWTIWYLNR
jgi:translocator protein